MGNRETEQTAIAHVMALEQAAGRAPKDVRTTGLPYDVESPPRKIEVKAFSRSARSEALPLEHRQVTEAKADPDHYYVYVVDNLAGTDGSEVGVRMLHGDVLLAMIERSQPQITYWPTFKQPSMTRPSNCAERCGTAAKSSNHRDRPQPPLAPHDRLTSRADLSDRPAGSSHRGAWAVGERVESSH